MGLGAGSPLVLAAQGVHFAKPLPRLREILDPHVVELDDLALVAHRLAADQARDHVAVLLHRDGAAAARARLPLYIAATGPRAVAYAGEAADGALLNVCLPTSYVRERRERLAAGARRAGCSPAEIEVAMCIVVSPHEDAGRGRDAARSFVAVYLSMFPNVARETGLDARYVDDLRSAFEADGVGAAARLVGDDVVNRLTAAGTVDGCLGRIEEYRDAGVELPILSPVDGALELTIDRLH